MAGAHSRPKSCAQAFLTKLLTVDLPGLIVLPRRLDVNIPPSVGAVAEAAVGRDAVMRAVASAVLQAWPLSLACVRLEPCFLSNEKQKSCWAIVFAIASAVLQVSLLLHV